MEQNKKNIKTILGIITFTVLLLAGMINFSGVMAVIGKGFALVFPFLLGLCIAFVLNVPMSALENKLLSRWMKSKKAAKLKRPISLVLTVLLVLGILVWVSFLLIPQIATTASSVVDSFSTFSTRVQKWAFGLYGRYPEVAEKILQLQKEVDWQSMSEKLLNFVKNSGGDFLNSTIGVASSVVGFMVKFFLALVFSFYVLLQKEKLGRQTKLMLYAFLPEKFTDRMLYICSMAAHTFSRFLSGQCVEAVILGTMFFVSMSLLKFPYALLIGVFIALMALIPIFGSFMGCLMGVFLIFVESPIKAFWFLVLFLVLQQIEGNLIYPHVVGGSVGLPSIWVLVAVTVGGSTMGIPGMLIFIPLCSVVYSLLREEVYKRLLARYGDRYHALVKMAAPAAKEHRIRKKKNIPSGSKEGQA